MIPVQYRDPETEEVLERSHEEYALGSGTRVRIGFGEHQVLFRWRGVPTSCIDYERRFAGRAAAYAGPSLFIYPSAGYGGLLE